MPRPLIAVDAMGGDHAPGAAVEGAVLAVRRLGVAVALVGDAAAIRAGLDRLAPPADGVSIVDTPDVVRMDEAPLAALRRKPRASVRLAVDLVARGEAVACLSAGHTGATLLAAHTGLGLMPGVERPALAVTVPTRGGAAVLVDAGANVDCRPEHLVQFGVMGAAFARVALGRERPAVALLSIGEEAGKGNDLIREAHARLAAAPVAYLGNLEARELFSGRADVIVCDGFAGNIALKVGEGLVETLEHLLRAELGRGWVTRLGAWLARGGFRRLRARVDYTAHGAAPILGVRGLALVAHGRSPARAFASGIGMAARLAEGRVVERLGDALGGGRAPAAAGS